MPRTSQSMVTSNLTSSPERVATDRNLSQRGPDAELQSQLENLSYEEHGRAKLCAIRSNLRFRGNLTST